MVKKCVYTQITPIPRHIPRQLAIDMLHSHGEIIELNPLVIEHHPIKAPQNAPADEFFSVWHEITERIQYIPGMGKMGSGKISFKGVFHDMPWGLQTHIYAPMGVDLRNKWQIRGNQPGEPPEARELGSGAPAEGLYLREDVEIKCNMTMLPFVKKETKAASAVMVQRLVRKAELLDSGVLHAMFENGRLKAVNPALRNSLLSAAGAAGNQPPMSPGLPPRSPGLPTSPNLSQSPPPMSPNAYQTQFEPDNSSPQPQVGSYHYLRQQEDQRRRQTLQGGDQYQSQQNPNQYYSQFPPGQGGQQPQQSYGQQSYGQQSSSQQGLGIVELAGDSYYQPQHQQQQQQSSLSSYLAPQTSNTNRQSAYSELSGSSPVQTSFNSSTVPGSDRLSSRADSVSSRPSSHAAAAIQQNFHQQQTPWQLHSPASTGEGKPF